MVYVAKPWQERFWRHLTPGDPDACWEWIGQRRKAGYGILMMTKTPYRTALAHRLSWALHNGAEIPLPEVKVLHSCDNPPCCNPRHLFTGTQADNVADMDCKGRGRRSGKTTYSQETIDEIRVLLTAGMTQTPIARRLGVTVSIVKNVRSGRIRDR